MRREQRIFRHVVCPYGKAGVMRLSDAIAALRSDAMPCGVLH
jgi:hypothetical protein